MMNENKINKQNTNDEFDTNDEFVPIQKMINEKKELIDVFQIQGKKDDNICAFVHAGKYETIPIVPIFDKQIGEYNCSLMSFLVTRDTKHEDYNLIGFLIKKNNVIGASLLFSFVPHDKNLVIDNRKKICNGTFEINLVENLNGNIKKHNIKKIDTYIGKEESIYLLTEVLLDVIEKNNCLH